MDIKNITEKITLPVAILLLAIILAIGFYAVQYNKQQSIERQQQIEIQEDRRIEKAKAEQTKKEQSAEALKGQEARAILNNCLAEAERVKNESQLAINKYINEGNLDGVSNPEVLFNAPTEEFEKDKDECFRKYPQ